MGSRVAVGFNSADGGGVEVSATLQEVCKDGIVLSQIRDLVPGPTLFCPWGSFRQARDRSSWFKPPREEAVSEEELQIREVPEPGMLPRESDSQEPLLERRAPSARTLERVVPVTQRVTVDAITVAVASLELHGDGLGVLQWWISFGEEALRRDPDLGFGMPEPLFEIRDERGQPLSWSLRGADYGDREADGDTEIRDLPDKGVLEVGVPRLGSEAYEDSEYVGEGPSYEGPWVFRFTL